MKMMCQILWECSSKLIYKLILKNSEKCLKFPPQISVLFCFVFLLLVFSSFLLPSYINDAFANIYFHFVIFSGFVVPRMFLAPLLLLPRTAPPLLTEHSTHSRPRRPQPRPRSSAGTVDGPANAAKSMNLADHALDAM